MRKCHRLHDRNPNRKTEQTRRRANNHWKLQTRRASSDDTASNDLKCHPPPVTENALPSFEKDRVSDCQLLSFPYSKIFGTRPSSKAAVTVPHKKMFLPILLLQRKVVDFIGAASESRAETNISAACRRISWVPYNLDKVFVKHTFSRLRSTGIIVVTHARRVWSNWQNKQKCLWRRWNRRSSHRRFHAVLAIFFPSSLFYRVLKLCLDMVYQAQYFRTMPAARYANFPAKFRFCCFALMT